MRSRPRSIYVVVTPGGMEHVGSRHQQIEVVVDEFPVLQGWQMWCKGAEHRARVAGEIDDRERRQYG